MLLSIIIYETFKGELFNLNVVNKLTDARQLRGASIVSRIPIFVFVQCSMLGGDPHWHGLLQKGTSFMDGATGVTQCPIAPGSSFLYSFNADHAGTFWYHSHFGENFPYSLFQNYHSLSPQMFNIVTEFEAH